MTRNKSKKATNSVAPLSKVHTTPIQNETNEAGKRADKAKQTEMAKNFEERTQLLQQITQIASTLNRNKSNEFSGHGTEDKNPEDQKIQSELVELWGRHGFLMTQALKNSSINYSDFISALFPSLQEGNTKVVSHALTNFEFFLDLLGDSLLPRIRITVDLIKHNVQKQPLFYSLMTMIINRYGNYLDMDKEMKLYVESFMETSSPPEALQFFAAILKVYGGEKEDVVEQAMRLLDLLGDNLKTNACYLEFFNELMYRRPKDEKIQQIASDLTQYTKGKVFLDENYTKELEKTQLLCKTVQF